MFILYTFNVNYLYHVITRCNFYIITKIKLFEVLKQYKLKDPDSI